MRPVDIRNLFQKPGEVLPDQPRGYSVAGNYEIAARPGLGFSTSGSIRSSKEHTLEFYGSRLECNGSGLVGFCDSGLR